MMFWMQDIYYDRCFGERFNRYQATDAMMKQREAK